MSRRQLTPPPPDRDVFTIAEAAPECVFIERCRNPALSSLGGN